MGFNINMSRTTQVEINVLQILHERKLEAADTEVQWATC